MPSGPRTVTGDSPVSREPSSDLAHDTRDGGSLVSPALVGRSRHRKWGRSLSLFSGVPSSSCPLFGPVNPLFLRAPTPSRFHARCTGRHCLAQRCHCARGQPRHHGDTWMDWWICTSAGMYLRNVCHPGSTVPVPGDTSHVRLTTAALVAVRGISGGMLLSICLPPSGGCGNPATSLSACLHGEVLGR